MLPESVHASLRGKQLLDFGLAVEPDTFRFHRTHCVSPAALVVGYALAMAASGKASRILMAGFDGYGADDPRTAEVDRLLADYRNADGAPPLLSITPSRYKLPSTSVYSLT